MGDANEVMNMLLQNQIEGGLPDDDPQTTYLITAWARICKILGKQFEQYLPLVMGPVMRTAQMKPEVALLDNDEVQDIEDDVDWSFINLGEQQNFAIRTAGMEDKASACEMLVCYARELKEGFAEYSEESIESLGPNCLSEESMKQILEIITKYMVEHFERADKRSLARHEEDYDDGVEEALAEEDDTDIYLLSKVADIIHALFLTNKVNFLPFFDQVSMHFIKLLDASRT
uniref:Uncharacterized protein n=1 Tax=Megaselia scalaris TaxID=36166 RepID=T1GZT1_MEGSC